MLINLFIYVQVIEGAAGVVVAAYMYNQEKFRNKKVAMIICGSNVSTSTLRQIIEAHS